MDSLLDRGATAGALVATVGIFVFGVGAGAYVSSRCAGFIVRGINNSITHLLSSPSVVVVEG